MNNGKLRNDDIMITDKHGMPCELRQSEVESRKLYVSICIYAYIIYTHPHIYIHYSNTYGKNKIIS